MDTVSTLTELNKHLFAIRALAPADALAEVLDRSQAQDRFGSDLVARWEEIQTEKLQ